MSVKKNLILAAAGVVAAIGATAALAGGPDVMPVAPAFQPSVYVEGHAGYALQRWTSVGLFTTVGSNGTGGFTAGGDIGYQFTRHLALEFGGFYLPRVTGTFGAGTRNISNWFLYGAAKVSVPVYTNIDLFAKFGAVWRQLRHSGTAAIAGGTGNYWRPLFAAGANYHVNENWNVGFQYMLVPNNILAAANRTAPSANLFTGFIGYSFAV